jgi:hypothetical protein
MSSMRAPSPDVLEAGEQTYGALKKGSTGGDVSEAYE